jgi:hypothetical protein
MVFTLLFLLIGGVSAQFPSGGYQGGGHGSGGDQILVNIPEKPILVQDDLWMVYPNPFHEQTTIKLAFAQETEITLTIHDVNNRLVRILSSSSRFLPGEYEFRWDGKNEQGELIAKGVYYLRLSMDNKQFIRKIVHL